MQILGDPIFSRNPDGTLKSRIGTVFFRTPGLVTQKGVHALQRLSWVAEVNRQREAAGRPPMSEMEAADEMAESADLIFTDEEVLIRPDPNRMDLAFRADEVLQTFVSKRLIRFLNTHAAKVRSALQARGENWRMTRAPLSPEEMDRLVESARCSIRCEPIFFYNSHTGTRFFTAGGYTRLESLPPDRFRAQMAEIVKGLNSFNRLGQREIDIFPPSLPQSLKARFRALDVDGLDDAALKAAADALAREYRAALPARLRVESISNLDWRNEMCHALTRGPNETAAQEQDLVQGISPEFYRQIEWLPGARVENGRVVFDPVFDEAQRTKEPALMELCDNRARNIIFNMLRLFGKVDFVNVGRIAHPLVRHPLSGVRRGGVYIVQYKEVGQDAPRLYILRFQKWGIAEHLDEGKDQLRAGIESAQYADYILDRRLACRQLGMNLPNHLGFGQFTEPYRSSNQYNGTTVIANYFVRAYVPGTASDKLPPARFANPAFAKRFAELMGAAAALDLVVGRAATGTRECVFDMNYEVFQPGDDGLPEKIVVTDHAGSFVLYQEPFDAMIAPYARVVRRRREFVGDYAAFAKMYVAAFERKLAALQADYRANPTAFDELFAQRPFDVGGSMAYRWHCTLKRLAACDPHAVAEKLAREIDG